VCDKCEVSPEKLECQIKRTGKKVHAIAFCKNCGYHGEIGFLCVKCDDRLNTYTIDGTDGWRTRVVKYDTDSEDRDYKPTESQSDVECKESMRPEAVDMNKPAETVETVNLMIPELWDRVWAYCADCDERGDMYLPCKTCYGDKPKNGSGCLSHEEGYSSRWRNAA